MTSEVKLAHPLPPRLAAAARESGLAERHRLATGMYRLVQPVEGACTAIEQEGDGLPHHHDRRSIVPSESPRRAGAGRTTLKLNARAGVLLSVKS